MIRSKGMKNLSATSVRKIRRMIAAVLAEPELYDQNTFGESRCVDEGHNICGTVCCGAGWAVWLDDRALYKRLMKETLMNGGFLEDNEWEEAALNALDLTTDYNIYGELDGKVESLFGGAAHWPEPFNNQYEMAKTPKQRAKVFAKRWEKFISSDGMV